MAPLTAAIKLGLRYNNTVLVEEVLVVFIPLVPVNDRGFGTSAEGLENFVILRLVRKSHYHVFLGVLDPGYSPPSCLRKC